MTDRRQVAVEPLSFGMTGFKVEDLISKDVIAELRRELPTAITAGLVIGFTDSKEIVAVAHDRREGKYNLERVDVEGTEVKLIEHVVEVLKKVVA